MARLPSGPLPPASTEQVLAVLEEYVVKAGEAFVRYETRRKRVRAIGVAGGIALLSIAWAVALTAQGRRAESAAALTPALLGLAAAVGALVFAFTESVEMGHDRDYLWALTSRIDPILTLAIAIHEQGEQDAVRKQLLNMRFTAANLLSEQVLKITGRTLDHVSPYEELRKSLEEAHKLRMARAVEW